MSTCAILFVRNPLAGQVKTRLQPQLNGDQAAELYRAFVLDSADTLAATSAAEKVIAFTPAAAQSAIRELLAATCDGFEFVPQPELDLGGRMEELLRWSFARGALRTVIAGSDSPSLPASLIDQGLNELADRDLVIGPATDGGYYLIGGSRPIGNLFTGIDWGTGRVFSQTLAAARGLDFALLPPWYDIDTVADAAFLRTHLEALRQSGCETGRRSLEILRQLDLAI